MYRLYLKREEKQLLLPVTPSQMETRAGNRNGTVYILNRGEINLAKKPNVEEIRFLLLLPGRQYSFVQTEDGFHEPSYYLEELKTILSAAKPVQLILFRRLADGSPLFCGNTEVLLESYTVTEKGGEQGDLWVDTCWKEFRRAQSIRYRIAGGELWETGRERPAKTPAATYQVRKGDSLWSIAKGQLGDGSRYRELAAKNGIANPNLIYPGQVLQL